MKHSVFRMLETLESQEKNKAQAMRKPSICNQPVLWAGCGCIAVACDGCDRRSAAAAARSRRSEALENGEAKQQMKTDFEETPLV